MTTQAAALIAARLLLAGVFALAGVTKLLDLAGSRQALKDFDVPDALIPFLGPLLPAVEVAVSLALLSGSTAAYGAIGGSGLLLAFTGAIGRSLARGRRPDCHCFGQLHSKPVGWQALARNGALELVALFIVFAGWTGSGPGLFDWLGPLAPAERAVAVGGLVALALFGLQSTLLIRLRQKNLQLQQQLQDVTAPAPQDASPGGPSREVSGGGAASQWSSRAVRSPAPDFALPDVDGNVVSLEALRADGKPVVLLFTDPACGPCNALLPDIGRWQQEHQAVLTLAVVSRGSPEANRSKIREHQLRNVLLQRDREIAYDYRAIGTPSAVVIEPDGTIGSLVAPGPLDIRRLLERLAPPRSQSDETPIGNSLHFEIPDLDGRPLTLEPFRGKPTLLLFWNPACGFCRRMLNDLRIWEARSLANRPQLLVVSAGTVDDNRALGLASPIGISADFSIGKLYGATGTPSALLLDEDGRPASKLVSGPSAILALVGQPEAEPNTTHRGFARTTGAPLPAPLTTLPSGSHPAKERCVHDELLSDGSMVLYNSCRQQVLTVNATAALVWECCDGEHGVEAMAAEVREVFPEAPDAESDVRDILDRLLQAGMISPSPAATAPATLETAPSAAL